MKYAVLYCDCMIYIFNHYVNILAQKLIQQYNFFTQNSTQDKFPVGAKVNWLDDISTEMIH